MPTQTIQVSTTASHRWNPQLAAAWTEHAGSPAERDALAGQSLAVQRAAVLGLWARIGLAFRAANLNPTVVPTFLEALRDGLRSMVYAGYHEWATARGRTPRLPVTSYADADWHTAPLLNAPVLLEQATEHAIPADLARQRLGSDPNAWPLGYDPFFASVLEDVDPQATGSRLWALTPALRLRFDGTLTEDTIRALSSTSTTYPDDQSGGTWTRGRVREAPTSGWDWFGLPMNAGGAAPSRGLVVIPPLRAWYDAGLLVLERLRARGWQFLWGEAVLWTLQRNLWVAHLWGVDPNAASATQLAQGLHEASARLVQAQAVRRDWLDTYAPILAAPTLLMGFMLPWAPLILGAVVLVSGVAVLINAETSRLTPHPFYDFWGYRQPARAGVEAVGTEAYVAPEAPAGWIDTALIAQALAFPRSALLEAPAVTSGDLEAPLAPETSPGTRRARALLIVGALLAAGYGVVRGLRARHAMKRPAKGPAKRSAKNLTSG